MPQREFVPASPCEKRLKRQGYPCPRPDWTPAVSSPLTRAPICEGDLRPVEAVILGFHARMPAPVSPVNGSECTFNEPGAYQATPQLLLAFTIPRLEFSRQDNGESGSGTGHGWNLDDANRDIDEPRQRDVVAEIIPVALGHGGVWTIVFDREEPPAMPLPPDCLTVIHTGHGRWNGADDRIVELVHALPNWAASLVYTSDAKLRTRVEALGTQVVVSGTLLRQIATARGTMNAIDTGHSPDPRRWPRKCPPCTCKRRAVDHHYHPRQGSRAL